MNSDNMDILGRLAIGILATAAMIGGFALGIMLVARGASSADPAARTAPVLLERPAPPRPDIDPDIAALIN